MKKGILIAVFLIISVFITTTTATTNPYKNWRKFNLGANLYSPTGAATGGQFHFSYQKLMDQTVSYGGGTDIYVKSFEDKVLVQSSSGPGGTFNTYETNAVYNLVMLSPQFLLDATIGSPNNTWRPWIKAGLGLDILFSNEKVNNDSINTSDSRLYLGFGLTMDAGINLKLGDYTSLNGFLGYHWGTPSRGETQISGLPIHEEICMNGLRLGIILSYKYPR